MECEYITVNQIVKKLGLSKSTVYKLLALKGCPTIMVGNKYIVKEKDFDRFMDEYQGSRICI